MESLAGTKWQMKNSVAASAHYFTWALAFSWKYRAFSKIEVTEGSPVIITGTTLDDYGTGTEAVEVTLYQSGWQGQGSNIISIAGGPSEGDSEAIEWFERNATLIPSFTLQEKEAIPTDEDQEITPDEGFDGLSLVSVLGSENLIPENIRKGVVIFGVVGTFEHEPDENLIPENIKKDVAILGVTGTFSGFDPSNPIAQMTNLAGSGQDDFVNDWATMARITLHEQGVSNAFLATSEADFIIAKAVTDLIEDGNLSATTLSLIATLRVNHPHTEDEGGEPNV